MLNLASLAGDRRLPALSVMLSAYVMLAGCRGPDPAAQFHAAADRPLPITLAHERDAMGVEPLRALPANAGAGQPKALVALGQRLYHDTRLSGDDSVACASCHVLSEGGDDGRATSVGIKGALGPINAPTVLNSAFNFRQFWDGRAADLVEQAKGPVVNPLEMGAAWPEVVAKLRADADYPAAFAAAFGGDGIDPERIASAIASFEQTLVTPAPFDRYLLGESNAISAEARRGYTLFKDYGCVACHQGINVGGNLYQKFGALQAAFEITTDADKGRSNVTRDGNDVGVFKVPSLRNVALTAPYFHVGTVARLEDAVRIMGSTQLGIALPDTDIAAIVAFLNSLTGDTPQLTASATPGDSAP